MGILEPIDSLLGKSSGLLAPDFTKGFCFVEYINGVQSEKAASLVTLNGNLMPHIPFTFGGTQKLVKEYYPGNPEPTTQVLGARESDLMVKGRFKAKRLIDPELRASISAIQEQCDAIRISGNLLRIWLGEWQRFGFLEEVTFKMNTLADIEYELKFSIVGFKVPTNNKFSKKDRSLPIDVNMDLVNALTDFQSTYTSVPESMPQSIADILVGAISDVAEKINLVTDFVDDNLKSAEDIVASVNRAIGLVKNAKAGLSIFKRRIGALALTPGNLSTSVKASASFSETYNSSAHIMKSLTAVNTLAALLSRMKKQFALIANTVPLSRYRVKEGDSLQRLAMKFYKNSDQWKKIYDHNKLTTTELVPGAVLEIPRV